MTIWPQVAIAVAVVVTAVAWHVVRGLKKRDRLPEGVARFLDGAGAHALGAVLLVVAVGLLAVVVQVALAILARR